VRDQHSQHAVRVTETVALTRLTRRDPPALGAVELTGRLHRDDAGLVYAGHHGGVDVVAVLLTAGAETDSYARRRFCDAVQELLDRDPDQVVLYDDDIDIAPWVAVRATSWEEGVDTARTLLAPVTLAHVAPTGTVQGPDFRPHWWGRDDAGRWRLWPLPWPRSLSQSGWWTFVASFALIVAIAALALWIAIKIFENSPAPPPGPGPGPGPNPPSTPTPSDTGPTTTDSGPRPTPDTSGPTGTGQPTPPIV